ncbi:unnamed protein product, partial [Rhizoctonia solani]
MQLEQRLININYLIIDTSSPPKYHSTLARVQELFTVSHIRSRIEFSQGRLISEYSLYKLSMPRSDLTAFDATSLSEPLSDSDLVSEYWPEGFPLDVCHLVLMKTSATNIAPASDQQGPVLKNEKGQRDVIQAPKKYSTSALVGHSQDKVQVHILNGCPEKAVGPPIGLFHPVFDSFQQRIDSKSFEATPFQLEQTVQLITACQCLYNTETGSKGRIESLMPILDPLLGFQIRVQEITGTKSDGVISSAYGAYYMIMEVMNEIGTGKSDPSTQGAVAYAKYWGGARLEWLRQQCCCPSFILAIAGPWMCILGAVMLKDPVIQPLTPFLAIANNPRSVLQTKVIAKTFASLAASLSELDEFYRAFRNVGRRIDRTRFQPYVREFTRGGQQVIIKYKNSEPDKAVFRASAHPKQGETYRIIVKFTESYNLTAHRLLEKSGLAPRLFFPEGLDDLKRVGQRIMIVMEEVLGYDLSKT